MDLCFKIAAELDKWQEHFGAVHAILDDHESKIIRNAKDGYPEGRDPRELTLAERVHALCIYASDWKRWCEDAMGTTTKPDPGPGYRLLEVGEKIKPGDTHTLGGGWSPTSLPGSLVKPREPRQTLYYRRKIEGCPPISDVGEGYRLLQPGEPVQENDEVLYEGDWQTVMQPVAFLGDTSTKMIRRKIEANSEPDPGPGYRRMNNGEVTHYGDDVWNGKEWEQADTGCPVIDDICRRKIEVDPPQPTLAFPGIPGEGYRLLTHGETVLKEDDHWDDKVGWCNCTLFKGDRVGINTHATFLARRKIEVDPPPQSASIPVG
jgi:hypothetical protein